MLNSESLFTIDFGTYLVQTLLFTPTCTSPFGPANSSGSAARLQKATSPVTVVRRDKVKSISVTVTPLLATSISWPLEQQQGAFSPFEKRQKHPLTHRFIDTCMCEMYASQCVLRCCSSWLCQSGPNRCLPVTAVRAGTRMRFHVLGSQETL